jgi:exopolysaccharide production protein ExoZ
MKYYNIQALRAFAAVCVVYLHTGFRLFGLKPFGLFGVDVFFVISGFIMAMIVSGGGDRFFVRRRLIRILPLYWTATLAVFILASVAPQLLKSTRPDVAELVKSLLFIPFRKESGLIQPMLFLGWTLNFEMFFYVVIGLSLLVYKRRALVVTSLFIVAVVAACTPYRLESTLAEFYAKPVALEFIIGMAAYHVCTQVPGPFVARYKILLSFAACGGILAQIWMEEAWLTPPALMRAAAFGGASFMVVLSLALLSRAGLDVRWKWIVAVGDASYALYIIHPYIEYAQAILLRHVSWLGLQEVAGLLLSLSTAVLSSIVLHRKFERPITNFLSRKLLTRVAAKPSFREEPLLRAFVG